jgi:hypothetical protein
MAQGNSIRGKGGPRKRSFSALSLIALCFLGLGAAYLWGSFQYPMGSLAQPGAGIYPVAVGVLVGLCSVGLLIGSLVGGGEREPFPQRKDLQRQLAIVSSMTLFGIFLKPVGYLICCFVFVAITLFLLGFRSLGKGLLLSALIAAGSYFLFNLLGTQLPEGVLSW